MTDVLDDIQVLHAKQAEYERKRARREADVEIMETRIRDNLLVLEKEYGVGTVDEAKVLLGTLQQELEQDVQHLKKLLEEEES
jgi:hypothetical protein